jgi:O-antigen/teichoic acid export membrane protein
MWLGLAAFSSDLIHIMSTPPFYAAAAVVPIVSLALVFDGLTFMVKPGILISKRTVYRTVVIFIAAGLNLPLNFLLIPRYGMMGAAWALLLGFAVQVVFTWYFSQRLYRVPYPYARIAMIIGSALAIYGAAVSIPFDSVVASIAFKAMLMPLYPVALVAVGLVTPLELARGLDQLAGRVPRIAPFVRRLRPLLRLPATN